MMRVLQALSEAGGLANEDLTWVERDLLALLDGSTSLVPTELDARWFTRSFVEGMKKHPGEELTARVNHALEYTEELYRKSGLNADADYYPSAAGIFVQEREGRLEILAVGDCTGLFFLDDGSVMTVTEDTVKRLDDGVLDYCREVGAREEKTVAEMVKTEEVRRLLLQNRRKMNRPDGYRILAVGMQPCEESDLIRLPVEKVRRIVLHSDGFDAVQDGLLEPELSLERLYERLRRLEAQDPDFEQMPRFKPGDDASALAAEVVAS